MTKVKVKVEKTDTGYSAFAEKYAAYSTGESVIELKRNMVESLNLFFEEQGRGRVISMSDLSFELEITSIFSVYSIINMNALAKRLDMNNTLLSQYATGKKKPSPKQSQKILLGIQEVGRELADINLI